MNTRRNEILNIESKSDESNKSLLQVAESKAVAEVQAQYVIAKKFPRDENASYLKIMKACERPFLAEQAMYAYPRGGQTVKGPSIRLAEVMSQYWGNIDCGIREVSQTPGSSIVEAYAIDLETNVKVSKVFHVSHYRDTRQGKKLLTDSRDIYEMVANQGARRLRACLLAILPGDIVDAAIDRCSKTLESSDIPLQDRIRKMIVLFHELGIKKDHIEKRLGHDIDLIVAAELVSLTGIYKSIKDGMADRTQFFEIGDSIKLKGSTQTDKLKQVLGLDNNNDLQTKGFSQERIKNALNHYNVEKECDLETITADKIISHLEKITDD